MAARPAPRPGTLLDYFPNDYLLVIDESHMTLPQIRGMYTGDRSRKQTLVDYGFRLPSALDNRPLQFEEFWQRVSQVLFTSATPGPYEAENADATVQQIIRPTGILDPLVEIRPAYLDFANLAASAGRASCPIPIAPREGNQIDDLMQEIARRVHDGQRAIVTTLTQKQAEDLAGYLNEMGIKAHYLHAEIDTLERVEILRDLRLGTYDVVVGINLLREGIDLPEVSLMAILDADKEGFLRSEAALIQIIGRAARHVDGRVIMYADRITAALQGAIRETARRREIQARYNDENGIQPASIQKEIRDLTDRVRLMNEEEERERSFMPPGELAHNELITLADELEREMRAAADAQDFEKAIVLRDQMFGLRAQLAELERKSEPAASAPRYGLKPVQAALGRGTGKARINRWIADQQLLPRVDPAAAIRQIVQGDDLGGPYPVSDGDGIDGVALPDYMILRSVFARRLGGYRRRLPGATRRGKRGRSGAGGTGSADIDIDGAGDSPAHRAIKIYDMHFAFKVGPLGNGDETLRAKRPRWPFPHAPTATDWPRIRR